MDDPRVVIINANLDDDQLKLANWLANEPSEFREVNNELLIFIQPYELDDLSELLTAINGDWFSDGVMEMSFNGSDVVIDAIPIIQSLGVSPKVIYPEYEGDDSDV